MSDKEFNYGFAMISIGFILGYILGTLVGLL